MKRYFVKYISKKRDTLSTFVAYRKTRSLVQTECEFYEDPRGPIRIGDVTHTDLLLTVEVAQRMVNGLNKQLAWSRTGYYQWAKRKTGG